jgi:hypothetical protein
VNVSARKKAKGRKTMMQKNVYIHINNGNNTHRRRQQKQRQQWMLNKNIISSAEWMDG